MRFLSQFGLLLALAGVAMVVTVLVSSPSAYLLSHGYPSLGYHWMQWSQTLVLMILAPLCWYRWYHVPSLQSLSGKAPWKDCVKEARLTTINWKYMFVTFCLMLVAVPILGTFEVFLNNLPWPEPIRNYIQEGYEQNQAVISSLLAPTGVLATIEQFLLMCFFTAVGEELMFRGALLSCFRNTTQLGIHTIALIIGFIFALIHFEPAGFVVRMLLGMLLVYLVYWSGSLWPSILAHCMNNSYALIGYRLATPEEQLSLVKEYPFGPVLSLSSFVLSVAVLYVLWQMRGQKVGK